MERTRNCRGRRIWLMVATAALVLKSAVPLLAAVAAHAQGKAVADICEIYGVRTIALSSAGSAGHADHADHAAHAPHAGSTGSADGHQVPQGDAEPGTHAAHPHASLQAPAEETPAHGHSHGAGVDPAHCALTGLAACAVPAAPDLASPRPLDAPDAATPPQHARTAASDPRARWLAERLHAPPLTA
jgi:hypothetical protein